MAHQHIQSSLRPAVAQRLHEMIVQQLTEQIVIGSMPPGSMLPTEMLLSQQFEVSRPVIREALRLLVAKGLIAVKQGSGAQVLPSDQWNHLDPMVLFAEVRAGLNQTVLQELLELRLLLEMDAAELAAQRRNDEDLHYLQAILAEMQIARDDPDEYARCDVALHERIAHAAKNKLLRDALQPVVTVLKSALFISARQPGAIQQSYKQHEDIVNAIIHQDSEAARAAIRVNIEQFARDIRMGLQQEHISTIEKSK